MIVDHNSFLCNVDRLQYLEEKHRLLFYKLCQRNCIQSLAQKMKLESHHRHGSRFPHLLHHFRLSSTSCWVPIPSLHLGDNCTPPGRWFELAILRTTHTPPWTQPSCGSYQRTGTYDPSKNKGSKKIIQVLEKPGILSLSIREYWNLIHLLGTVLPQRVEKRTTFFHWKFCWYCMTLYAEIKIYKEFTLDKIGPFIQLFSYLTHLCGKFLPQGVCRNDINIFEIDWLNTMRLYY